MLRLLVATSLVAACAGSSAPTSAAAVARTHNDIFSCKIIGERGDAMKCDMIRHKPAAPTLSSVTHTDVAGYSFGEYHYCVFTADRNLTCAGYVWVLVGGTSLTYVNPLAPNSPGPSAGSVSVYERFLSFNLITQAVELDVETRWDKPITAVECVGYRTCVTDNTSATTCFGAEGVMTDVESAAVAGGVQFAAAAAVYVAGPYYFARFRKNLIFVTAIAPAAATLVLAGFLLVILKAIVHVMAVAAGALMGTIAGFLAARQALMRLAPKPPVADVVAESEAMVPPSAPPYHHQHYKTYAAHL